MPTLADRRGALHECPYLQGDFSNLVCDAELLIFNIILAQQQFGDDAPRLSKIVHSDTTVATANGQELNWPRCLQMARFCRGRPGRAFPLCPGISDVNLFSYRKRVIDLNAEVSDGAFDFGMPEQELHRS